MKRRRKGKADTKPPRRKGYNPSELELALLEQVLAELLRCRALAGFPAKRWAAGESHCTELLERLREGRGLGYALEAVRATVWSDSKADPARLPEVAAGTHATLTRIFRRGNEESPTGRIAQVARWVEEWIEEGRPEPRSTAKSGPKKASTWEPPPLSPGAPLSVEQLAAIERRFRP